MLSPPAEQGLKITQILVLSLLMGMTAFGVMTFVLPARTIPPTGSGGPNPIDVYRLGVPALLAGSILAAFVLGRVLTTQTRAKWSQSSDQSDPSLFAAKHYQIIAIMRGAFLEGAGLFAIVASLTTGDRVFLAAAGVAALALLAIFPTRNRLIHFMEQVTGTRNI